MQTNRIVSKRSVYSIRIVQILRGTTIAFEFGVVARRWRRRWRSGCGGDADHQFRRRWARRGCETLRVSCQRSRVFGDERSGRLARRHVVIRYRSRVALAAGQRLQRRCERLGRLRLSGSGGGRFGRSGAPEVLRRRRELLRARSTLKQGKCRTCDAIITLNNNNNSVKLQTAYQLDLRPNSWRRSLIINLLDFDFLTSIWLLLQKK